MSNFYIRMKIPHYKAVKVAEPQKLIIEKQVNYYLLWKRNYNFSIDFYPLVYSTKSLVINFVHKWYFYQLFG